MIRINDRIKKGYAPCTHAALIKGGADYFNLLIQLINAAQKSIHLQVYIFDNDSTGKRVAAALKAAAQRKVAVYMMIDGYASQGLPAEFIDELQAAGIHFRFFEPFLKSRNFYFGRRMHHKVMVVDALHAVVAGINIADRYNDTAAVPAWLDFALYIKGNHAKQLCDHCRKQWKGYIANATSITCETVKDSNEALPDNELLVKICRNDWVRRHNQVSAAYIEMLRNAEHHVIILCSYFLPGRVIRRQIVQAVRRGVEVKVITAGTSDISIAKNAERWLYDYLLRNNVKLYEYQKNILHGKIAVCDGEWMTAGSYNINSISAYASIELNLAVQNTAFATEAEDMLNQILTNDCILITKEQHSRSKNIFRQFARWFSYQFIRAAFYLFTFYYKQKS
ncbi:MAG: phospholipase [Chitinophagaceae bacterium]|nr:phospholipase [Chitinophagaceae bacterium]